ncbi:NUDIX hydrolase [Kitasatospora viridis]|uniref:ADP-ribose pyrophosphatase YjhB (NUDIX family) n=1 Tax=Kitasatospora viridis TaxID=281105 RepID=A0A561TVZ2_9ACTN|nr:NUDIX hydrolase [Kitasatospora viridis]TWF91278.1 ADP-ribose pyrophosphatase YjhB (NUDIX family) [Kitasatospora viridis]
MTTIDTPAVPIRTCVAIVNRGEVCLIHRRRTNGDQFSFPGGLLNPDEEVLAALLRELKEELDLDVTALADPPALRWVQDQVNTRPGTDTLFRRLHLIHVLDAPDSIREHVAATEQDAEDTTRVVWIPLAEAADLHLYPAAGPALAALASGATVPVQLPPMHDRTYSWR